MIHSDHRHGASRCPSCGRLVDLNRNGCYRRHFTVEPDGRRHLCVASGRRGEGVVRLLGANPTPEERHSHAFGLLRNAPRAGRGR
jgi:hypothetical protein